jgi:hypothetical protein
MPFGARNTAEDRIALAAGRVVGDRKRSQMSAPVPHADGIGSQEMFAIPPA